MPFARLIGRFVGRRSHETKPAAAPQSSLVFESLEPRLLLAADPLGATASYAFNESSGTTTVDISGHGITGTLTNGATFTTAGKNGNAVALDGVNDYVNLGNPAALQLTGSMTVSAWIYATTFPGDDGAIVSKRNPSEVGFQLDTTVDTGRRTIGFKLTNSSGGQMFRFGATTLQANTWYYVTGVYNAGTQSLDVYLNGVLDNGVLQGTVTSSQQNSANTNVTIGRRAGQQGFEFIGRIDDVRIADHALTADQILTDMTTPLGGTPAPDTTAPTVTLTAPAAATVGGTVTVSATATDNIAVAGVQFLLDNNPLGAEDTTSPYSISWNTTTATNGQHTLAARARDVAGNITVTSKILTVDNQAPTGTIVINGGAAATNDRNVTLTLSATDALSTVTQMRFSSNGTTFSAAEAYATTKAFTLTTGAGTKTVYVQFQDAAGNWSASFTDTIVLDTTAPTVSARTVTAVTSTSVTVNWTTNEAATSQIEYGPTTAYGLLTTLDPNLLTAHSVLVAGLAPSTTYNYRIRTIDAAGNQTLSSNGTFTTAAGADTVAPSVPTGLTATAVSTTQINLSWTASTDNVGVTGYRIFRDGGTTPIATVTTTTYSNTGLTAGTTYQYTVRAIDAAGNASNPSAAANATTAATDTTAPSVPTGLTATAVSASQINLAWTASTDNVAVTGYRIFRNGGPTPIATVTTTIFSDAGLTAATAYQYTVSAIDAAGNASAPSAAAGATTAGNDTTRPTVEITAPAGTSPLSGTVTITANAADDVGVASVQFFVDGVALAAPDTTSPYSIAWDTTTAGNGTHTLLARALDAAGNLGNSTPITVTVTNTQATGLAAAYGLNETSGTTTADASGHNLSGALAGGATFAPGKYGNGVRLDGVNDYVDLGNPTALQLTGSMTISAWINTSAFPGDDAAIVSKRVGEIGFQLDTTVDTGRRTIGFKLTNSSGAAMFRFGATTLQANAWYHVTGVYDAASQTLHVYLNGQLDDGVLQGTVTATQTNSTGNIHIGQRPGSPGSFNFNGLIDDVRIYSRALTQAEIQADMATALGGGSQSGDTEAPTVALTSPAPSAQLNGIVTVTAIASDNVGVTGVQFLVDGQPVGQEDSTPTYALTWDTRTASNGAHTLTARARDAAGNVTVSTPITVNVANASQFVNEVLATGFNLPTAMTFLPDGRLLVVELAGTIKVLQAPYTTVSPTPFLQLTNVGSAGVQQGLYEIKLDPNFTTNHFYYVYYTAGSPNHDRLSRFTANATLTGTIQGSELILYEDQVNANAEHHGGAINFGNDGKIYLTTGEHFNADASQDLRSPRGKILRFNPDGTVPTDNPFYDGAGPNYDAIWALGLRNPFRAYYDAPTGRLFIGDVGGNNAGTAWEEINLGVRGANYGWPNVEGTSSNPSFQNPIYTYPHSGRDSAVVAGFVYHGTQFPSAYQGSFFFADYTQNWIKRLTLDANGNVTGVFNFEPANGAVDGPYGDIVYLTEGPEGSLYYLDLGYSDISFEFGLSKLRRISFINSDLPPIVNATATPATGPAPLQVAFSSAGSSDPEGQTLSYLWTFGDGQTSTAANPTHTYASPGPYQARLSVSDGVNTSLSTPMSITVGNRPEVSILSPTNGLTFRAGDVITYSGSATDAEDGALPASAYSWSIDFLHDNHVHPGTPIVGVTGGSFVIPTSGHDFNGNTRYRITLTVTDTSGLQSSTSVIVTPQKVNLSFDTNPAGGVIFIDGIAHTGPFVYDTLVGFTHTIEARNQVIGAGNYAFASWSDGGAQIHNILVPAAGQTFTAVFTPTVVQAPLAFVQVAAATPQTNQTAVSVAYASAQTAGNTNILAIGWNNDTSNITSVVDSAGNIYQLAVPVARGPGLSQAIYYASNIKAAAAGTNTVTVTFNTPTTLVDIRALEYSGLDPVNPFDVGASSSGISPTATSGSVTTTAKNELIFAAAMTGGVFSGAGTGFTSRIITTPDGDIAEDRFVTSVGTYSATAPLGAGHGSSPWLMQVAAFRAANQT